MGMNGSKGRAKTLARIRRHREAEARAAGIDPKDRAAFYAWDAADRSAFYDKLRRQIRERTAAERYEAPSLFTQLEP